MEIDKLNALIIHAIGFAKKDKGATFEEIKDYLIEYNFKNNDLDEEIKRRIDDLERGLNGNWGKLVKKCEVDNKEYYYFCEPNKGSINFWLGKYKQQGYDDGYFNRDKFEEQENAVRKAFACKEFQDNKIESIIIKATLINSLYSTSILDLYSICKEICDANICDKITKGDVSAVHHIATLKKENAEKSRLNISFASKYCHHTNQNKFPIYDRYVVDVLLYFYNKDKKFREHLNGKEIAFKKNGQKTKNKNNEKVINEEHNIL